MGRALAFAMVALVAGQACTLIVPAAVATREPPQTRVRVRKVEEVRTACLARRDSIYQQATASADREARRQLLDQLPDCTAEVAAIPPVHDDPLAPRIASGLILGFGLDALAWGLTRTMLAGLD